MSLVASDSVQCSGSFLLLGIQRLRPKFWALKTLSVTVHRLTMHIITLGDATMVLSRMSTSTFDIKDPPSQDPMPLKIDGHWPPMPPKLLLSPSQQLRCDSPLGSQTKMGSYCGSWNRLTTTLADDFTSK